MHQQMIHLVWKLGQIYRSLYTSHTGYFLVGKCFDLNHSEECFLDRRSQLVSPF